MATRRDLMKMAAVTALTPAGLLAQEHVAANAAEDLHYQVGEKLHTRWLDELNAEMFEAYDAALRTFCTSIGMDIRDEVPLDLDRAVDNLVTTSYDIGLRIGAALESLRQATSA